MASQKNTIRKISILGATCVLVFALVFLIMTPVSSQEPPATGGITGTTIYYGTINGHLMYITVHPTLVDPPIDNVTMPNPGGYFEFHGLADGAYYVGVFLDVNDTGGGPPDPGEPQGWYDANGNGTPDSVTISGGDVANIDFPLGDIIYVEAGATGTNNGTSWLNAYTSLQSGLADPKTATAGTEIWVAAGTYKPTTTTDRTKTFQLKNGVGVYGGFAGNEKLRLKRDLKNNITILSGEIGNAASKTDNSYHVVTGGGVNRTAILSDVTIMRGYANENSGSAGWGGGMKNYNGTPTVANVRFIDNATVGGGGAGMINAQTPSPGTLVINCTFSGNTTTGMGAGMYSYTYSGSGGYAIVINTTFVGNTGEAVFVNGPGSSIYLVNSIVWGGINILTSGTASIYSSILSAASCHASATCDSGTKFATNPLFVDANGADDIYGTIDDNLRLQDTSPAIDSGNNTVFWIPVDEADLDGDGNRTETIPIDFDGAPRYFDAPPANTGTGTPPIVDMGAFENQTQAMQPLFLPLIMK